MGAKTFSPSINQYNWWEKLLSTQCIHIYAFMYMHLHVLFDNWLYWQKKSQWKINKQKKLFLPAIYENQKMLNFDLWECCGLDLIRAGMWTCLHSCNVKGREPGKEPPLLLIYATHKANRRENTRPWSESAAFHRQPWVHEERSQSIIYPHSAPLCLESDNTACPLFNYTAVGLHFFQYASQLNCYRVPPQLRSVLVVNTNWKLLSH